MIRGTTRKRTGSSPIVVSASTSWFTCIVPISAANAAPVRPASRIAVISGPSSRTIAMPTRSATKISAPKRRIGTADWNARIRPIRNEISATIGRPSAPTRSLMRQTSLQRTTVGRTDGVPQRCDHLADELDLVADVAPDARRRAADFLDDRRALRLGVEIVLEPLGIELPEQHVVVGPQVGNLDRSGARVGDQVDEKRNAGAVAVLDPRRVDGHRPGRSFRKGAVRVVPELPERGRVEASRQRQHAAAVRSVADSERRRRHRPPLVE